MYTQRVERDLSNIQPIPIYPSNVPAQKNGGIGNGLLNFGVALGGILLVTIITGIITYMYRKKINCNQKASSKGSRETNDNISSIMDYYSNNYTLERNVDNPNNHRNDASGSGITNNNTTIKTNKNEYNLMNVIKNIGVKSSDKTSNKSSNDKKKSNKNSSDKKNKKSKSVTIEKRSKSDTAKNNRSKSLKQIKRSSSNEKIEYIVPQISSPISMPSASIYDIERASSLANSLSRSTAFQVQTPPNPPIPIRIPIINKQPKDVERSSGSQQKYSSKLNSFYNLIPFIFMDPETETNTKVDPSEPPKTTSIATTSSAGVIPDWSKAPWNDDLTFHKNNNDNNDNSNSNNINNNDNNDNNDNNNDNNNNDNNNYDDSSSHYSEDLIRFSNGSKYSTKSRTNPLYRIDQQVSSPKPDSDTNTSDNDNPESSGSKSQEYNRGDFIKELKINIEKDPEKYEFLKNPAENHHNWKRNGNFFEYRLQRSKTII